PEIPLPQGVQLAYLPHYFGVDLRLMVSADNARIAEELIEQPQGWLKRKLGALVYGEDDDTLESVVGGLLRGRGAKVALAESCTAGMIAARLADVPGSSDYLERGYVTYSNQSKVDLLGVSPQTIEKNGAVSKAVASEMALGALKRASVDFAISVTGIAGPDGGSAEKPVGLVWIAIARKTEADVVVDTCKFFFGPDRRVNRERATGVSLNLLRLALLGEKAPPLAEHAQWVEPAALDS
ncbi:MAG: nicotinamide-nucleotide amidohydrolase family protein, partial [Candidatus Zixiibacteriota bacterium]